MSGTRRTGWEVMRGRDGSVTQSGVRSRPANAHQDVNSAMGWITRGVVLQVYYANEDRRVGDQKYVLCDVRTYGRNQRYLPKVPVLQRVNGLWDYDVYVPRRSSQDINGGELRSQPTDKVGPTPADACDGDHVLVGFLDNDPNQPVIMGSVPHPKANYSPQSSDGHVRVIRHNGVSVTWDSAGNWTLDATGAAKEALGSRGSEVSNSGTGGVVTLRTKDGARSGGRDRQARAEQEHVGDADGADFSRAGGAVGDHRGIGWVDQAGDGIRPAGQGDDLPPSLGHDGCPDADLLHRGSDGVAEAG